MGKKVKSNRGYATTSVSSTKETKIVESFSTSKKDSSLCSSSSTKDINTPLPLDPPLLNEQDLFYTTILKELKKHTRSLTLETEVHRKPCPSLLKCSLTSDQETCLIQYLKEVNPPLVQPSPPLTSLSSVTYCTSFTTHLKPSPSASLPLLNQPPTLFFKHLNYVYLCLQKLGFPLTLIPWLISLSSQPWDLMETLHLACLVLPSDLLPKGWTDKLYHHCTLRIQSLRLHPPEPPSTPKSLTTQAPRPSLSSSVVAVQKPNLVNHLDMNFEALNIFDLKLEPPSSIETMAPPTLSFTLQGWSGKTPEQLLRDTLIKENKRVQLKFIEQESEFVAAYRTTCHINEKVFESEVYCSTPLEAKNYIATVALYHIAKGRPLYKVIPPSYREIWMQLDNEQKSKELDLQTQLDKERIDFFQSLLDRHRSSMQSLTPSSPPPLPSSSSTTTPSSSSTFSLTSTSSAVTSSNPVHPVPRRHRLPTSLEQQRAQLPVTEFCETFLDMLSKHSVMVVQGATGSGKSTQIPQFILEHVLAPHQTMYCTQPRRISAISLAERVTQEWGERHVGKTIGYSVKLESKVSRFTKLVFCTTGVLLRILEKNPELTGIHYLIIDEVHERTIDCDFLLVMVKQLLVTKKDLKVILMSATLQGLSFSKFFPEAPTLEIPGKTFPVDMYFLEDVLTLIPYEPNDTCQREVNWKKRDLPDGMVHEDGIPETFPEDHSPYIPTSIQPVWDRLDPTVIHYELIVDLIQYSLPTRPSILVFMPGLHEIQVLLTQLQRIPSLWAWPLHSSLSAAHQRQVFARAPSHLTKVIVATNLAETGITIDDITMVIDTGKAKITHYDSSAQLTRLSERFISKSNCMQRKGRAGRTRPGVYYALFSKYRFEQLMPPHETPEILRMPLESTILRMKWHGFDDLQKTFTQFMDAPKSSQVATAIQKLQTCRALDDEQRLTLLGQWLVQLPLDVELAKLLVFGAFYQCLSVVLTMIAYVSANVSVFESKMAKLKFHPWKESVTQGGGGIQSDVFVHVKVYDAWVQAPSRTKFCRDHQCSWKGLQWMHATRQWLLQQLPFGILLETTSTTDSSSTPPLSPRRRVDPRYDRYGLSTLPMAVLAACYPTHVSVCPSTSRPRVQGGAGSLVTLRGDPCVVHSHSLVQSISPKCVYTYFKALVQTHCTLFEVSEIFPSFLLCLASLVPWQPEYLVNQVQLESKQAVVDVPSKTLAHLREFHHHLLTAFEAFLENPQTPDLVTLDPLLQVIQCFCTMPVSNAS
ncbi:hypothetical protein HMI54_008288 [Coelomomyces lativittatus]|nr:hypothetical protein HMI56_004373 [Coelomomyces lativittatus]KAJ1512878.1 hypothetical protein HMI55_006071 [Coelomomyces lativittatus]KAJ1516769.1 hypothetical protein HMI54_008288 [Coelomomyces lativittatus]